MSKIEHTPGPWTREREIFLGKLGEDPDRAVVEFQRDGVTIGYWYDCEWDGYSPNSQLIEAVTDLLTACVKAVGPLVVARQHIENDGGVTAAALTGVLDAIAKATH